MASLGDLVVNLKANNANFNRGMKSAQQTVADFSTSVALIGGAAGIGLVKIAADAETLQLRFKSLLKSGDAAAEMLDEIGQFAANTPFGKVEIADATRTLLGFQMGAEDAFAMVKNLGEVSAQSGANMGELANIFGKALAKNKVEAETLNQLIERQVPILRALAQVTGESESQLYKLASAGQISGQDLQAAFDLMGTSSDYAAGAMGELAKTTAGQWSTMLDNAMLLGEGIGKVLLPPINAVLSVTTGLIQKFQGFASLIGTVGGSLVAAAAAVWAIRKAIMAFTAALQVARSAQVMLLAVTGPKGWAVLAAGVAVAAGAVYGMDAIMADATETAKGLTTEVEKAANAPAKEAWEPPIVKSWRDVESLMRSIREPRENNDIAKFNAEMKKLGDDLERADRLYDIFSSEGINYNMSLTKTMRDARNEMSGFNSALEDAEQELANVQAGLTSNQIGNNEFLAMGVAQSDVDRLASIQAEIDRITESRKAAAQAEQDAAREAERKADNKKRMEQQFASTLKDTQTQLKVQLGLMSQIDAQVQAQRDAGMSGEQLARYRELLEAQDSLSKVNSGIGQPARGGVLAERGSERAFQIIANAGKDQKILKESQKQTKKLQDIANNTKNRDALGLVAQGPV